MRIALVLTGITLFSLSACGPEPEATYERATAIDAVERPAPPNPGAAAAEDAVGSEIPVAIPKIAYVYSYGFRTSPDKVASLQLAQADLCDRQGPQVCRILDMRQSGMEGEYASGSLTLAVAAPQARAFGAKLAKLTGDQGGTQISTAITGEDLSKQMVDTEARLQARTVLRDRLMDVLKTRRGTVTELVEAERAVARVNEEIDQARSWLAEMRQRVNYSRVEITYTSGAPSGGSFVSPIRDALGSISAILGNMAALGIILLTVLIPLGILGWAGWRIFRRFRPLRKVRDSDANSAITVD